MMNLQDMKAAVAQLSPEEVQELRDYLEQVATTLPTQEPLAAEERIRRLDEAAAAIRSGFSDSEWDAIEKAMNEEYVEDCVA